MAQSRDSRQLGPLTDKLLVFIGEFASGADGLSAKDEKRLSELVKKARSDQGLTVGERLQVIRLAYKAVPADRLDDFKRLLTERGGSRTGRRTRPKLRK
jgi:hypothetical protein